MDEPSGITFSCTMDTFVRKRTRNYWILYLLLPLAMSVFIALLPGPTPFEVKAVLSMGAVVYIGSVLYLFMLIPLRYVVTSSEIVIVRRGRNASIPLASVTDIQHRDFDYIFRGALGGGTAHGWYGFLGEWYGEHIKDFFAFAVRKDNLVVIVVKGRVPDAVLSPDDVEGFISAVKEQMASGQHQMSSA